MPPTEAETDAQNNWERVRKAVSSLRKWAQAILMNFKFSKFESEECCVAACEQRVQIAA